MTTSLNFRHLNVVAHRYLGLLTAVFLLLTALSGSLLAFNAALDDWFNRKLAYVAVPSQPVMPLPMAQLHDKVITAFPTQAFSSLPVSIEPNKAVVFNVDRQRGAKPATQQNTVAFHQVFVNPYTGVIIGTRNRDVWAWHNTMYKVFWFHRNLLLGDTGQTLLGVTGLLWVINCFIGLYLTLPRKTTKQSKLAHASAPNQVNTRLKTWLKTWRRAWKIRKFSSWFKLNFDAHHAFGLWFWGLSLAIAWSSVGLNLRVIYDPVMQYGFGKAPVVNPTAAPKPKARAQQINPQIPTHLTVTKYQAIDYLTQQARLATQQQAMAFEKPLGLRWLADSQAWQLRFTTNHDVGNGRGASSITVDALTGKVSQVNFGSQAKFANQLEQGWHSLHMGHFDTGLYRIVLALFGLITGMMTLTGCYLWLKGHNARTKSALKKAAVNKSTVTKSLGG